MVTDNVKENVNAFYNNCNTTKKQLNPDQTGLN